MNSYYSRPWRGYFEVLDGPNWMRYNIELGSVEQGLGLVETNPIPGLKWRIVDAGGNVYEAGRFDVDAEVTVDGNVLYLSFKTARDGAVSVTDKFGNAVRRQAEDYLALIANTTHVPEIERRARLEASMKEEE